MRAATSHDGDLTNKEAALAFVGQLQGLMQSLSRHVKRETEALRQGAYGDGLADLESKSELFRSYHAGLERLRANASHLSRFAPVQLDELRKLNAAFQEDVKLNLAAVATARGVSEQLLTRLAARASETRKPKTYAANGAMAYQPQAAAVSVDRAL
ncbi:MAG: hypothetical protein KI785_09145 [Devosiaceae bacterium]|nr:hypothetical protein [Devosiaceae bacterium MH13]